MTKIYWSPAFLPSQSDYDWGLLYQKPMSALSSLNKNINKEADVTFFECPATSNFLKNTFVLKNSMTSDLTIVNGTVIGKEPHIGAEIQHMPSIKDNNLFTYRLWWVFFTEDDSLEMTLTSPFFHQAPHLQYGALVPGKFDIGKWFRLINLEFNLWEGVSKFVIEEDEPMAYVHFNTKEPIEMIRFQMNDQIEKQLKSFSMSTSWEPGKSLVERYLRFKKSDMKDVILKNIKDNIIV